MAESVEFFSILRWCFVTPTVTLLAKMLLPNQRRIQYKVTFFTWEVTFFDGTSATEHERNRLYGPKSWLYTTDRVATLSQDM